MDKKENCKMLCGEITAFLSMIFLLILALVGTTLESARISVGRSFADRSLQNAMDSLYTEYCRNLWEDYHIFFLEGEENESKDKDYIRNTLFDYMDSTFCSEKQQERGLPSMDLLEMEVKQLKVVDIVRADDYEGELLLHEILEYEKYQEGEEFFAGERDRVKALEETNACMTVVEKQMEAEENMAEVNLEVLEFLSLSEEISKGKKVVLSRMTKVEREAKRILSQLEKMEESEESGEEGKEISYKKLERLEEKLIEKAEEVLEQTENAQRILYEIREKQPVFAKEAEEFESVYENQKDKLSAESQRAFETELGKLKGYAETEAGGTDSLMGQVFQMEPYLEEGNYLLEEILTVENMGIGSSSEEAKDYVDGLKELKKRLKENQRLEMQLEHNWKTAEKNVKNPVEIFWKTYKNSILGLVAKDVSQISQKAKKKQTKASGMDAEEKIEQFNVQYNGIGWLESEADEQLQILLLTHYMKSHFKNYSSREQEMETALDYEAEYILGGKLSDKENLEAVLKKIVFLRTILNYTYLMTDTEKSETAYGTAVALVGFSGMEPLVRLTKNMILFIWAAEEAMVDAGALLQEKEVPVFKTNATFGTSFEELLSFGREQVQRKIAELPERQSKAAMDYQQYLGLLFNFCSKEQKLNGIMDLIEDNMRLRYDEKFVFGNCIYGIEVEGEFLLKEKFLRLPLVQQLINTEGEGFQIYSHKSYCYE